MGTALVGVTSINSEKWLITARSMKDEESADVNNTNAAIYAKIESVLADGIFKQAIELEKETNVYKPQDAKVAGELNKLKAKQTDPNFKKYLENETTTYKVTFV